MCCFRVIHPVREIDDALQEFPVQSVLPFHYGADTIAKSRPEFQVRDPGVPLAQGIPGILPDPACRGPGRTNPQPAKTCTALHGQGVGFLVFSSSVLRCGFYRTTSRVMVLFFVRCREVAPARKMAKNRTRFSRAMKLTGFIRAGTGYGRIGRDGVPSFILFMSCPTTAPRHGMPAGNRDCRTCDCKNVGYFSIKYS
jgi:hypothetical protein